MSDDVNPYIYSGYEHFVIKQQDHFYIAAHGVEGIRLRVDSPTMDKLTLKMKLLQLTDTINKYL